MFALEGERRTLNFAGRQAPPDAVGAARLFGAGAGRRRPHARTISLTLLKRDSDSFNRWQAMQSLATRLLMRSVAAIRAGRAPAPATAFIAAYGSVVEDAIVGRIDPAFAALALALPGEADLAREIGRDVDPDAIRAARESLRGAHRPRPCRQARRAARQHGRCGAASAPMPPAQAGARCATARWR